MKKVLTLLALLAFTTTAVMALDGDTYRAEREQVEQLHSSGYIMGNSPAYPTGTVNASSKTKKGWFRRNQYQGPDMDSYYNFGGFNEYKGYNGQ